MCKKWLEIAEWNLISRESNLRAITKTRFRVARLNHSATSAHSDSQFNQLSSRNLLDKGADMDQQTDASGNIFKIGLVLRPRVILAYYTHSRKHRQSLTLYNAFLCLAAQKSMEREKMTYRFLVSCTESSTSGLLSQLQQRRSTPLEGFSTQ